MLPREKHFTCAELACIWNTSSCTVRRDFQEESGVVHLGKKKSNKRKYDPLRIPESVAERVYRRKLNGGQG